MTQFNFGNSLKSTSALVGLNCSKVKLEHPICTDPLKPVLCVIMYCILNFSSVNFMSFFLSCKMLRFTDENALYKIMTMLCYEHFYNAIDAGKYCLSLFLDLSHVFSPLIKITTIFFYVNLNVIWCSWTTTSVLKPNWSFIFNKDKSNQGGTCCTPPPPEKKLVSIEEPHTCTTPLVIK